MSGAGAVPWPCTAPWGPVVLGGRSSAEPSHECRARPGTAPPVDANPARGLKDVRFDAGLSKSSPFLPAQVDAARNLVYVVGQVPGHKGNFVLVSDAVKKSFDQQPPRPLAPPPAEDGSEVQTLKQRGTHDPYAFQD